MKILKPIAPGLISSVALGYPTVYPTGTTIYDPDNAYSSYILIAEQPGVAIVARRGPRTLNNASHPAIRER